MDKSLTRPEYRLFLSELKKARKKAGLNQTELGIRLGKTQSFISKVERGERRLDFVEVSSFCAALNLSLVEFARRFAEAGGTARSLGRKRRRP